MTRCNECGQPNPSDASACLACGALLADGATPLGVRRQVTIVCADIRDSTELAGRIDPETLRPLTERYFARMRLPIERHGGTVEKFIGDAVLAVFGLPKLHADDALRAVRAAVEMQAALPALNEELDRDFGVTIDIGIGVNTGEVVAGDVSSGETFATGEAVNIAARLQGAAAYGEILIGEPTHRLVRDAVRTERGRPLALRGKQGRTEVHRVLAIEPVTPARYAKGGFVGRAPELTNLMEAFNEAASSCSCRLVTVLGPAGIGKSRLAAELYSRVGEDVTLIQGRCLPYGDGITYWPLREALQHAAGMNGTETTADARDALRRLLAGVSDCDLIAERLLEPLDLAEETAGQTAIAWAAGRLFHEIARTRPLVVLFDDLQWAEPSFLDLVEFLAEALSEARVLLLCLTRPEILTLRPSWCSDSVGRTLELEPLGEADAELLAGSLLGAAGTGAVVSRISTLAEGNPFFVEELASMLEERQLENDAIDERSAVWLPPTIGALLAARIDALPTAERAVLERASVEGKHFQREGVHFLAPPDERFELDEALAALARRNLISRAEGDEYAFRHQLLRDAAYESLPKARRAQLHERFADWLEQRAGGRAAESAEVIGYHLEQADRYRTELRQAGAPEVAARAVWYLEAAGRRAHARGDMHAAEGLLTRALGVLPENADQRELVALREDALFALGRLPRRRFRPSYARCFLRPPVGHRWTVRERGGRTVLRCAVCGKTTHAYRRPMESSIDKGVVGGFGEGGAPG